MNRSYRGGLATLACACVVGIAGGIVSATADAMMSGPPRREALTELFAPHRREDLTC